MFSPDCLFWIDYLLTLTFYPTRTTCLAYRTISSNNPSSPLLFPAFWHTFLVSHLSSWLSSDFLAMFETQRWLWAFGSLIANLGSFIRRLCFPAPTRWWSRVAGTDQSKCRALEQKQSLSKRRRYDQGRRQSGFIHEESVAGKIYAMIAQLCKVNYYWRFSEFASWIFTHVFLRFLRLI